MDCTDPERAGRGLEFAKDKVWVNIDHHDSNSYFGVVNFVNPNAAATGELVYDIINALEVPDTRTSPLSVCGNSTDTGGFRIRTPARRTYPGSGAWTRESRFGDLRLVYETRTVSSIMLLARACPP